MDMKRQAMEYHGKLRGKIEVTSRCKLDSRENLMLAYTPGVAEPCLAIQKDVDLSYTLTRRWNTVAVVTDGTAVLGLGDIGPEAAMPVMEGKCALFKELGGVDAIPLCLRTKDTDEIVNIVRMLAGSFGGVNLEDISAPRCFEIERKLARSCDIPIFHDDQHGTAVSVLAAMMGALRVAGKEIGAVSIVIAGAGAAGIAVARLLMAAGAKSIVMCDRQGVIYAGRGSLNPEKAAMAGMTNSSMIKGGLAEAMAGADVFIGVSGPGIVTERMVSTMAPGGIVFAMSNPTPEIMPEQAKRAGAAIVGTGRSDYPNQINNILAFPGIFRGALDARASNINDAMKMAAAEALSGLISEGELCPDYIIPAPLDPRVCGTVAESVADAARKSGVARKD